MRTLLTALIAATCIAAPATAATFVNSLAIPNGTDFSGLPGAGLSRLGGFGSDLIYNSATGLFYGMSDRGPGGGVLPFAPRLQAFSLNTDPVTGAISNFALQQTTLFKQPNGVAFNGLNPLLLNGSKGVLGASLDPEGLARLPNGNFLVSDEYGPSVHEFDAGGVLVRTFATPDNLLPRQGGAPNYVDGRPTINLGRQDNRGFEGLTLSPDGKTAYAVLQDPLVNEGVSGGGNADGRFSRNVRIVAFDVASGTSSAQYIYQLEDIADINGRTSQDFGANDQGRSIGVSAIQALGDGKFLVLERDNRGLGVDDPTAAKEVASKQIFLIDIKGATDVSGVSLAGSNALPSGVNPVAKKPSPYLDIAAALRALNLPIPEKIEGFAFGPKLADGGVMLLIATDNDFSVTQSGSGTQFDVCTSGAGGTSSQVALGSACPDGTALIPNMLYSFRLSAAEYAGLTSAVPEPTSWAMMIGGFGMVGGAMRRRRKAATASLA